MSSVSDRDPADGKKSDPDTDLDDILLSEKLNNQIFLPYFLYSLKKNTERMTNFGANFFFSFREKDYVHKLCVTAIIFSKLGRILIRNTAIESLIYTDLEQASVLGRLHMIWIPIDFFNTRTVSE